MLARVEASIILLTSRKGLCDTECDSSKNANVVLCFHCNAFTACDARSVPLVLSHSMSQRPFLLVYIHMLALLHYCFIMVAQLSQTCALALSIFAFPHIWYILYIFITMICLFIHLLFLDNGITQLNKFLYYLLFNCLYFSLKCLLVKIG